MTETRLGSYLEHMLEAATQAIAYVEGLDRQAFLADKRTQQAVILNIVVIGEVATRLLKDHASFLDAHPELPWRSMKGMRNRVAHGYFDIDVEVVWETVRIALPDLVEHLPAVRLAAQTWV